MPQNQFRGFTNKYSISKTLRFELIPQGKTINKIESKGLLQKDEELAASYRKMKETINGFHKDFIELAMSKVKMTLLEDFKKLYDESRERKKEEGFIKDFKKIKDALRKEIVCGFTEGEAKEIFSKIDKRELFTELLEPWLTKTNRQSHFDDNFKTFTSYFGGFHENRMNMYSDKDQSTAIAYRLIHENLPKFIDNIKIFEEIKSKQELYDKCKTLYSEIGQLLNVKDIEEVFHLDYYNKVLTQKSIDYYNLIIGGQAKEEGKKKIQGLNEYINLYNQKQEKNHRVPKLKMLYKQILSDRENISFLPESFKESQEVLEAIESYYTTNLISFQPKDQKDSLNVLVELKNLIADMKAYDLSKIYIKNDSKLTNISLKIFGKYSVFVDAMNHYYDKFENPNYLFDYQSAKENKKEKLEKSKNLYMSQSYITVALLEKMLESYFRTLDEAHEFKKNYKPHSISDYFQTHFIANKKDENEKEFSLIANIENKYRCIKGILNTEYPKNKKLNQDQKVIDDIKSFLDSLMEFLHFVKPLALNNNIAEKDEKFYGQFEPLFMQLQLLIPLYNKVRNYATQKHYSTEKFKLNFDNAQLLGGWDANKESDYLSSIFRKEGGYYLAIMDKKNNKVFKNLEPYKSGEFYEKMNYKLLPGVNKMLPKVFFSKKNIEYFKPSAKLLVNYKNNTHKKGDTFSLTDCHDLIDFFKRSLEMHEDWVQFNFKFSPTNTYNDISDFYREVSHQGYKVNFDEKVQANLINQLVEEGKIYLFEIFNKDFSKHSKGMPNIHTLYWKALFEPNNLMDVIYKLNGQAEIFYRKASINNENKIVHLANKPISNKNPNNVKNESKFEYDIIKDKRFTVNKFHFHVPITLNFKAIGSEYINGDALEYLKNNPEVNIIGIDRGERHLIYLTLIDQQGNILLQESLNTVKDNKLNIETPYHKLLDKREKERAAARENWGSIETIKDLKEGYLSQVVHKIAKMMVDYNAIVIMEDLNFGFKRGRFKVEKQIYQKLEKMLIDKLNYLVFKDKKPDEIGGLYNALQLSNKFESFQKIGKQCGFIFYVPAWNTSKIDPTTGFVNLFDTRYENMAKAKEFFSSFESIIFNNNQNYFEFAFDYSKFTTKAEGTQTKWTVCTNEERIITYRNEEKKNQWDTKTITLTVAFKELFTEFKIDLKDDLKNQIILKVDKLFFEKLLALFKLTLQMRNSITNSDVDYLISPVMNAKNEFYDSRKTDETLPKNADANGAFHIAKKGLWLINQINKTENLNKLNLAISNKEWLQFVQRKG